MSLTPIVIAVIGGLLFYGFMELWSRWIGHRMASVACDKALAPQCESEPRPVLNPERKFIVRLLDSEVVCERPNRQVERVTWDDLQKVEILTTSSGPFAPDVFWVLRGINDGCVVPHGATGDIELLQRLQTLPGFDNQTCLEAMACTSDRTFLCWQASPSGHS